VGDRPYMKYLKTLLWSPKAEFKFEYDPNKRLLRYLLFDIFRLSLIGGHLHLKDMYIIVWSSKLKLKI
jgi:hypothetical protein